MSEFCRAILNLDEEIRSVMIVDRSGSIECIAAQKVVEVPQDLLRQFGGTWSAVAGGVFLQLSQYLGTFEYAILYYEKVVLLAINVCRKYVITSMLKEPSRELIEKIKDIYAKKCSQ
ncbi:MAG: hypothetical protein ACQXXJ_00660 [Candidatus Bathyarchaeia archaeon]|jgi:hypothetical protein